MYLSHSYSPVQGLTADGSVSVFGPHLGLGAGLFHRHALGNSVCINWYGEICTTHRRSLARKSFVCGLPHLEQLRHPYVYG